MKHVHYDDAGVVVGITEHFQGETDPLGGKFFEVEDDVAVELGMDADPVSKTVTPNEERQAAIKAKIEEAVAAAAASAPPPPAPQPDTAALLARLAALEAKLATLEGAGG